MKNILAFIFIFTSCFANAQQSGTILIDWIAKTEYAIEETKIQIPQFLSDSYNFNFHNRSLLYIKKIPVDYIIDENSLQVTNIVYESISESKIGDLSKSEINNTIKASVKAINSRDQNYCYLSFSPIIKDESGYKKVLSLNYYFNKNNISINKIMMKMSII